ncbi:MAG: GAF domain-containing protein [Aggregatilineales bacterium]
MFKFLTRHLQTKLIIAFILALLVPTVAIGVYAVNAQTSSLIEQARANELAASQSIGANINNLFNRAIPDTLFLTNTPFIQAYAAAVASRDSNAIRAALNNTTEINQSFAYLTYAKVYSQVRLLDISNAEVLRVDYSGGKPTVATATQQLDLSDSDLFHQAFILSEGKVFAEQMTLRATNGQVIQPYQPILRLAAPVFSSDGKRPIGVLILTMDTQSILDAVKSDSPSQTAYLVDSAGSYLAGPDPNKLFGAQLHPGLSFTTDRPQESTMILTGDDATTFGSAEAPDLFQSYTHIRPAGLNTIQWTLYRTEPISVVLNSVNTVRLGIVALTLLALLIAMGIALLITGSIVRPVQQLATAAAGLSQGEWNTPLPTIKTGDELGALGAAFAVMARELRTLYANLEDRVRARTSELETVAKVSAATASILNVDELLQNVSDLTKTNFGLYHAHVYLLDDARQNLVLAAGAGEAGQKMKAAGHSIPLEREQSLVARAARTRRGVTVNDVTQAPDFLPNPLLPNTHSELAVPMLVGNTLIGVLDVQSEQVERFTDADVRVQTTLASQIAIAVQNARAFTQVEQHSSAMEMDRRRAQRLALVSAALSQATDERQIMAALTMSVDDATGLSLNLSYLNVDDVGTPIEGISMFNWPELPGAPSQIRYPIKNDPFVELWLNNPNKVIFIDDIETEERLNPQIRSLLRTRGSRTMAILPLYFANVWQGMLTLTWPAAHVFSHTEQAVLEALPSSVAAVLSNRRAYFAEEEARRKSEMLFQISERRASELETVAQVSAATTSLLSTDELLQSVADLTKDRFGLYHSQVYLLDEAAESLALAAGAGEAGRQMKAAGHRIPLARQQSLVARAARTQQAVIVNDVTQAADFLPNPLLPDTRAEMSVPMVVGSQVIGVLDMQSEKAGHFTEDDVRIQTTLADQIAIAVQNARLYETQVHTAEQLREVDRLKSEFLASMSHELRTPLNSIIGFSEVLADGLDGDLSEEAHTDVLAIHESGEHLLELINDVLDLAKIEAGRMELDRTDVELAEIVEEVGRTTAVLLKDKLVEMVYDLPLDLPMLSADAKRLRQILKNLVSNAAKFTEQGQVVISAAPTEDRQYVQVSVRDSGVGIAPQNLDLIFEQFRQVDNSSTRKVGGTGLGLPITRQLVQMHGGEIWVTSEPGVGSTFSFTMPIVSEAIAK